MSKSETEKAADEVRDELITVDQSREYNQGFDVRPERTSSAMSSSHEDITVDDAVEAMKKRWKVFGND